MSIALSVAALLVALAALAVALRAIRRGPAPAPVRAPEPIRADDARPPPPRPPTDPAVLVRLESLEARLALLETAAAVTSSPPAPGGASEPGPEADAFEVLRHRLERAGFERIRVGGASHALRATGGVGGTGGPEQAVDVEAVRGGLVHRGRVHLRDPADPAVSLHPATRLFP